MIAERNNRVGRINIAHIPMRIRSLERRRGARVQERLIIRS